METAEEPFEEINNSKNKKEISSSSEKRVIIIAVLVLLICVLTLSLIVFISLRSEESESDKPDIPEYDHIYIEPKSGITNYVFIFIHGFNQSPEDFKEIVSKNISFPDKDNLKIILPHSPKLPATAKNGTVYNSWFDIKKFPVASIDEYDFEQLKKYSKEIIQPIIHEEAKKLNGNYSKIFLGGFSQGGFMSFYTSYSMDEMLGGVVELSGILDPRFEINNLKNNKENLNIFIAHGVLDNIVSFDLFNSTIERIRDYNGTEIHVYDEMKHVSFNEQETADIEKFLDNYMK